uniref:Uncharacterized protein n=1 Tax=Oryza punctata TaxID=4537 RepID=A0A0E0MM73_ORYPU
MRPAATRVVAALRRRGPKIDCGNGFREVLGVFRREDFVHDSPWRRFTWLGVGGGVLASADCGGGAAVPGEQKGLGLRLWEWALILVWGVSWREGSIYRRGRSEKQARAFVATHAAVAHAVAVVGFAQLCRDSAEAFQRINGVRERRKAAAASLVRRRLVASHPAGHRVGENQDVGEVSFAGSASALQTRVCGAEGGSNGRAERRRVVSLLRAEGRRLRVVRGMRRGHRRLRQGLGQGGIGFFTALQAWSGRRAVASQRGQREEETGGIVLAMAVCEVIAWAIRALGRDHVGLVQPCVSFRG